MYSVLRFVAAHTKDTQQDESVFGWLLLRWRTSGCIEHPRMASFAVLPEPTAWILAATIIL
jgi:hypothetical protein